jgi:hypothetical protein
MEEVTEIINVTENTQVTEKLRKSTNVTPQKSKIFIPTSLLITGG